MQKKSIEEAKFALHLNATRSHYNPQQIQNKKEKKERHTKSIQITRKTTQFYHIKLSYCPQEVILYQTITLNASKNYSFPLSSAGTSPTNYNTCRFLDISI